MHLRLFEHPDSQALAGISRPALGVTGSLPNAKPSLAYEGRLTIVNAGGDCTVELLSGTLPPGATVSVDNATKQVVVAWPAYSEGGSAPFNGSFEQGAAGWELGPGWSLRNDHAGAQPGFDGTWDARYDGAGSALIVNAERRAVTAGQAVTASVQVEQGASSRGAAGAAVRLEWLSAGGALLGTPAEGNMVDDASGGAVLASTVNAIAPAGAAFARLGARGFRRRQNSPLWIDDFAWSLVTPAVGTNVDGEYCISIRVTDALRRTANWAGCVGVTTFVPDTLSPTNKSAAWVLSEGNMKADIAAAPTSAYYGALGEFDQPLLRDVVHGTRCAEFVVTALSGGFIGFGVARSNFPPGGSQGSGTGDAIVYRSPGGICASGCSSGKPSFTVGDVIGVRVSWYNSVVPGAVYLRCDFYKNGVLVPSTTDSETSYPAGTNLSIYANWLAGSAGQSAGFRVRTDPGVMSYFANYNADTGWPATSS